MTLRFSDLRNGRMDLTVTEMGVAGEGSGVWEN